MKTPLFWNAEDGLTPSEPLPPPARGELLVEVTQTLCVPGSPPIPAAATGSVVDAGQQTTLGRDTQVVFACRRLASQVIVPESSCFVSTLPPESALYLPVVADLLLALDQAHPDLGWNAVLTGTDEWAHLTALVMAQAGARSVSCLVSSDESLPQGATHGFVSLSGKDDGSLSHHLTTLRGPIVFVETTGRASVLQNVLDVIPPQSALILTGTVGGDVTSINFYADVHKKNIRIFGASGGLDQERGVRAERLLQRRLRPRVLPRFAATSGNTPTLPDGGFVFTWQA
jgi:threonine dehydrogenase-like Zn-dependent dehydrogenase